MAQRVSTARGRSLEKSCDLKSHFEASQSLEMTQPTAEGLDIIIAVHESFSDLKYFPCVDSEKKMEATALGCFLN